MSDNRIRSQFHRRWLAASVLALVVVLTATHIPQATMPKFLQIDLLDKVEHLAAYGGVAALFLLSVPGQSRPLLPVIGLLALAGIGILDEATQPLVNRYASRYDYFADVVGILLACPIFLVKRRFRSDTAAS
ncbi:MAG: VanZ family protein [Phycisphaerales bacterium]